MTTIPVIETERLRLRPFEMSDVGRLHTVLGEPDMLRYFPRSDPPSLDRVRRAVEGILEHWTRRGYGLWAVEPREGGMLLGRCGLQHLPDTDETEVDFLLAREAWGHGYATEGAQESLRYGFDELKLETIVGIVHPDNAASHRVLQKIGMTKIARTEYFGMTCDRYAIRRADALQEKGARAANGRRSERP